MRLIFFNRFFYPNTSATSQILADLAFYLGAQGLEVHVVCSRGSGESSEECLSGVQIHRVSRGNYKWGGLITRLVSYLQYLLAARLAVGGLARPGDVVVVKTDPPMLASFLMPTIAASKAKSVVWLQDVFPEIAVRYGIPGMRGWLGNLLAAWRDKSLKQADEIVVVADSMRDFVASQAAVPLTRITVIHNWADGDAINAVDHASNSLRDQWGLQGKFVVAYSGNLGRVHEFDTVLNAARKLKNENGIQFVFIGAGAHYNTVRKIAERDGLKIQFQPPQPRVRLAESLSVADVHLCVLRPEFEGLVQPSKLYGIFAAGRPTIFVGSPGGEIPKMLSKFRCGVAVQTGDSEALANAILELRDDPLKLILLGGNGRTVFESRFNRSVALLQWQSLFARHS